MKRILLVFVLVAFAIISSSAQTLNKVTDRLYMIEGTGGNVSFLVSTDCVLLVDAGTSSYSAAKIKSLVASVTPLPIKYIVLTHYHYDHVFGLSGFDKGITIIGHQKIYNNMKVLANAYLTHQRDVELPASIARLKNKKDSLQRVSGADLSKAKKEYQDVYAQLEDIKQVKIVMPTLTFEKSMTLYLGADTIEITNPGSMHTDCNSIVFFKNQKAIAMGDILFNHNMPYIDFQANSNTLIWINELKSLSATNYLYFISGHGAVGNKADVLLQAQYLTDLRADIKACIDNKYLLDQTLKQVKMLKYANWGFQFMLPGEVEAVYNELLRNE